MALTVDQAAALFRDELEQIERVVRFTVRRNGLSLDEAEELRSEVHLSFLEDDYRLLRQLDDPSALGSFLIVVIQRLTLDFRNRRWGRWRPSRSARRAGDVAVRLETLIVRDGVDFEQACRILRDNHGVTASREALIALYRAFPPRHGLASVSKVSLAAEQEPEAQGGPEQLMIERGLAHTEELVTRALRTGLATLPIEDRLLLRMVYVDDQPISAVARVLGVEQRPLYRRLEKLHKVLRGALEKLSVTREGLRDLLESRRGLRLTELGDFLPATASREERPWERLQR